MAQTFAQKKDQLLLTITNDLSPKGSVDKQIRPLVDLLNTHDGIATTSSCGGRVSVFCEGVKRAALRKEEEEDQDQEKADGEKKEHLATFGGKGKGGRWLFVSHDPVPYDGNAEALPRKLFGGVSGDEGVYDKSQKEVEVLPFNVEAERFPVNEGSRFVHFKFEPMVMHIQVATHELADKVVKFALAAGFRESGIMNLGLPAAKSKQKVAGFPILAVRSTGISLDSIVGMVVEGEEEEDDVTVKLLVPSTVLGLLVDMANQRFEENRKRIQRFENLIRTMILDH